MFKFILGYYIVSKYKYHHQLNEQQRQHIAPSYTFFIIL